MLTKIASIVAGLSVLLAAAAKVLGGDMASFNMTEVMLAVAAISAALGFQKK